MSRLVLERSAQSERLASTSTGDAARLHSASLRSVQLNGAASAAPTGDATVDAALPGRASLSERQMSESRLGSTRSISSMAGASPVSAVPASASDEVLDQFDFSEPMSPSTARPSARRTQRLSRNDRSARFAERRAASQRDGLVAGRDLVGEATNSARAVAGVATAVPRSPVERMRGRAGRLERSASVSGIRSRSMRRSERERGRIGGSARRGLRSQRSDVDDLMAELDVVLDDGAPPVTPVDAFSVDAPGDDDGAPSTRRRLAAIPVPGTSDAPPSTRRSGRSELPSTRRSRRAKIDSVDNDLLAELDDIFAADNDKAVGAKAGGAKAGAVGGVAAAAGVDLEDVA